MAVAVGHPELAEVAVLVGLRGLRGDAEKHIYTRSTGGSGGRASRTGGSRCPCRPAASAGRRRERNIYTRSTGGSGGRASRTGGSRCPCRPAASEGRRRETHLHS